MDRVSAIIHKPDFMCGWCNWSGDEADVSYECPEDCVHAELCNHRDTNPDGCEYSFAICPECECEL